MQNIFFVTREASRSCRLQFCKDPSVLCSVGVVQPTFPPQSCLLPRFFRTFPPSSTVRSPQLHRNPDESRACSCFLSSSAAAASFPWFVAGAVDLAFLLTASCRIPGAGLDWCGAESSVELHLSGLTRIDLSARG